MEHDQLFTRFITLMAALLVLFGVGMGTAIIWGPPEVAARMVTAFSVMFSGVLGLGSGYLLAQRTNGNGK